MGESDFIQFCLFRNYNIMWFRQVPTLYSPPAAHPAQSVNPQKPTGLQRLIQVEFRQILPDVRLVLFDSRRYCAGPEATVTLLELFNRHHP